MAEPVMPTPDPMLPDALRLVVEKQNAGISFVQRSLKLGYNRAAALLEALEEQGVVSPMKSSGLRTVLLKTLPANASGEIAPKAPESAGADSPSPSSAHGATAPLDRSLSADEEAQALANAVASEGEFSGAGVLDDAFSPSPQKSAIAQPSGDGGEPGASGETTPAAAAAKPKKPEKTIDWGKLNFLVERCALIYGTDTVWDGSQRMIMKIGNLAHAHGADMVRLWKTDPRRRTLLPTEVVFDPSETCGDQCVNLYDPSAMLSPSSGSVEIWLELLRFQLSELSDDADEVDEFMHYVLCWFAYPLQHPGAKLKTALVFHGEEGSGKSFLVETIAEIYGPYGIAVGQDELEDKFNDWRSAKRFVIADEVSTRAEMVHNKNRIKPMIASDTVQINPKNLPRRQERNVMQFVFLSNELQPLALDNSDRRFFVVWTPRARERDFYQRLGAWRRNGGAAALHAYLLDYSLDGFDPYAPAPITQAKRALITINRKSPELFWAEWANGELDLPYLSCSMQQVYRAYTKWCARTGDRYPFKREQFTPTVCRFSESQGRPARVKPMKLDSEGAKKVERMFLVCDPDEAIANLCDEHGNPMTQGGWATDCVKTFEPDLRTYLGWSKDGKPPSPGGSSVGEGDGE